MVRVTGDDLVRQWAVVPTVTTVVAQLREKRVLLITGDQDEIFPPAHYAQFVPQVPTMQWVRHPEADHQFSTCRPWLRTTVLEWVGKAIEHV